MMRSWLLLGVLLASASSVPASEKLVQKTYPINDLLDRIGDRELLPHKNLAEKRVENPPRFEEVLIKMITTSVAPAKWKENGGQGTIDYFPLGRALVINQSQEVQGQVAALLESLRAYNRLAEGAGKKSKQEDSSLQWARRVADDFVGALARNDITNATGLLSAEYAAELRRRSQELYGYRAKITNEELAPDASEAVFTGTVEPILSGEHAFVLRVAKESNGRWSVRYLRIITRD